MSTVQVVDKDGQPVDQVVHAEADQGWDSRQARVTADFAGSGTSWSIVDLAGDLAENDPGVRKGLV